MMRITRHTLLLLLAMPAIVSCKSGNGDKAESADDMAHGEYNVEKNQVTVVKLEKKTFNKQLICNGKLEAQNKVVLQFGSQGIVAAINYSDGQRVKKGNIIAQLDKKQAELQLESAKLSYSKSEMALADRLLDYGYSIADTASIPAEQKQAIYINTGFADARVSLKNAQLTYDNCELTAPFDGKITSIKGRKYGQANGEFCTIIDDNSFLVKFSILESEYPFVHVGQPVKITPFANQQITVNGSITAVNPSVDANGQIAITAKVPGNSDLIDGMNVRIMVEDKIENQLVVPKSAVVIRDGLEVLFRYVDGKSLWTYVNVVMSNATEHIIEANAERRSELNVGDLIVTSGNLNLGDDVEIEVEK